jgi:DNA-binding response OmpR family regulator
VLVVSDDAGLRAAAGRVLDRHGFLVLEASHAGHALLRCLQHAWPVDVLLIDAVMPDGCGRAAARRLQRRRPEMRTLFLGERGADPADDDTIPRPFTADDLLEGIVRVLDLRN